MKSSKRLISIVLAMLMVFTSIPAAAVEFTPDSIIQSGNQLSAQKPYIHIIPTVTESDAVSGFEPMPKSDLKPDRKLNFSLNKTLNLPMIDEVFKELDRDGLDLDLARTVYIAMHEVNYGRDELKEKSQNVINILKKAQKKLKADDTKEICTFFGIDESFYEYAAQTSKPLNETVKIYKSLKNSGYSKADIESAISDKTLDGIISQTKEKDLEQQEKLEQDYPEMAMQTQSASSGLFTSKSQDTYTAPYQPSKNVTERIGLGSGSLDYSVTDAVLPGAGGFDLVIGRTYDSSKAGYYQEYGEFISTYVDIYKYYYQFAKNPDGTMGEKTGEDLTGTYYTFGYFNSPMLYDINHYKSIVDEGSYFRVYFLRYEITYGDISPYNVYQGSYAPTEYDKMWNLGTGWRFNFSHIVQSGAPWSSGKNIYLSDGRVFSISPNYINNLGYYTYEDLHVNLNASGTVQGQPVSIEVLYADGKKESFSSEGRLLKIEDKFGNCITFLYITVNNLTEIQITDTLGQITSIYNTATPNGYSKIVELPDAKTLTYGITENVGRRTTTSIGTYNEYNLGQYIDPIGQTTTYSYTDFSAPCDFGAAFRRDSYGFMTIGSTWLYNGGDYWKNYYAGLSQVTYPNGFQTNYQYYPRENNWGAYAMKSDIAIIGRSDSEVGSSTNTNPKQYRYSNQGKRDGEYYPFIYNCDGYNNEEPESDPFYSFYKYTEETDSVRDKVIKNSFDMDGFIDKVEAYYDGTKIYENNIENRIYNQLQQNSVISSIKTLYNTNDGQPIAQTELFDYDNKGNVIDYWSALAEGIRTDNEHKTSMTFASSNPSYNILLTKTYKKDASTTITEQNILTLDGKNIDQALVYENGVLKKKSEFSYDIYGNITQEKEYTDIIAGKYIQTNYQYLNGAFLTQVTVPNVTDADGIVTGAIDSLKTYNIYGRKLSETNGNDNTTSYEYDDVGRVTRIDYPDLSYQTYVYNTSLNRTYVTDPLGNETMYQYNSAGNLAEVYALDGTVTTLLQAYTYDGANRLESESNNLAGNGYIINYIYDYNDRITQKETKDNNDALLAKENHQYYDDEIIKTVTGDATSPSIETREYYDNYGRLMKQAEVDNGQEKYKTFTYDYLGHVLTERSPRANDESFAEQYTKQYQYTFIGNPAVVTDVYGNFTSFSYDALGRKISSTDAKSNATGGSYSTTYEYDELGRLIKVETPFENGYSSIEKTYYDGNGNIIRAEKSSNLPGQPSAFSKAYHIYSNRDKLTKVESYLNNQVVEQASYEYDNMGNQTAVITAGGTQRTDYEYDRYGHVTSITDPLGLEETYTYNINGNLLEKTDKNGVEISYTYDGLGRQLSRSVTVNGQTNTESQGYTLVGLPSYTENGNLRTDYLYDTLGRVSEEDRSDGVRIVYLHDADHNKKTSITYVNNVVKKSMSYSYDKINRMQNVYENNNLQATYGYDANGNRTSLLYANGIETQYLFNRANMVTSLENKKGANILSGYTYTYYLDGNQAAKLENSVKLTSYQYDGLGRLTNESESGAADAITKAYLYDAADNRSVMTVSGTENYSVDYDYDLNNRLLKEEKTTGTDIAITDYYYDLNGNTISKITSELQDISEAPDEPSISLTDNDGMELYEYDGYNRLIKVENDNGVSAYAYGPDGLRITKTVNGQQTKQVWEGAQIVLEMDASNTMINRYIRGIGLIFSDNGYYLFNAHGDVVQLSDGTGTVTKTYEYDAFGNEKDIDAADPNPFRYCGEYYDKNSTEWKTYEGTWTVEDGKYKSGIGYGSISVINGISYSDIEYEADIEFEADNLGDNAGLIFRVNNISSGYDNFTGYLVGLCKEADVVTICRNDGNCTWTTLAQTNMAVDGGIDYHVKVIAQGDTIKLYINDMATPILSAQDNRYSIGQVGLRAYYAITSFDNMRIRNARPIYFSDNFDSGISSGWKTYEGTWTVEDGKYKSGIGYGSISAINGINYSDIEYEADIEFEADNLGDNAGLIFRANNISSGYDNFTGYLVGLCKEADVVTICRNDGNCTWTTLAQTNMAVDGGIDYHVKVIAQGDTIKLYINDMATPVLSAQDNRYSIGQAGLRAYYAITSFDNTKVSSINPIDNAEDFDGKETGTIYLRARYYDPANSRMLSEDPVKDGTNWYTYANNNPIMFVDPMGLDAIIITNSDAAWGAGHTSAIYQDESEDWYYTYWGDKAAAVIRIPDKYIVSQSRNGEVTTTWTADSMTSLGNFNGALNGFLSDYGYSNITSDYTDATYIVGDFTASLSAAYDDVDNAYFNKKSSGTLYNHDNGSAVFQGKNGAYRVLTNNCLQRTVSSFGKGTMAGGTSAATYLTDNGYRGGTIPNNATARFSSMFMNSSFTFSGAYPSILSYAFLFGSGTRKTDYAQATVRGVSTIVL